jgi:hypothetical protein
VDEATRFWAKVNKMGPWSLIKSAPGRCWVWTGAQRNKKGYGGFWVASAAGTKGQVYVHRWSYETLVEPIPDALVIDHLCRRPSCVNPAHLEPVTPAVNTQRGAMGHRQVCRRGHALKGDNLILQESGGKTFRRCKICMTVREDGTPVVANGDKTHCKRGHPLEGEHLIVLPDGKRRCRTCVNIKRRERSGQHAAEREAQRAAQPPPPPRICPRGHEISGGNAKPVSDKKHPGYVTCGICARDGVNRATRKRRAAQRAAGLPVT